MYKLIKIDLLDTYIFADVFDEEKYTLLATDVNLEKLLDNGINEFKLLNKNFHSFSDWEEKAEDGGYEIEILADDLEPVFRGSVILKDPIVENALNLARKYHYGNIRKGDGLQYIIHILQITKLLYRRGFDAEIIAAGFCHDLLEDTQCVEQEIEGSCGKEVLRIVRAVSNDKALEDKKDWEKKKERYIESVKNGGEKAIAVCLADKIVNLRALLKEYVKAGKNIWERFNRGKEKKLWFEKMVLAMAKENCKNALIDEYEKLIKELEQKIGGEK